MIPLVYVLMKMLWKYDGKVHINSIKQYVVKLSTDGINCVKLKKKVGKVAAEFKCKILLCSSCN